MNSKLTPEMEKIIDNLSEQTGKSKEQIEREALSEGLFLAEYRHSRGTVYERTTDTERPLPAS